MSILSRLMEGIRLNDTDEDDDYYLDDDYDEEEERPARRGFFSNKRNDDEYYDAEEDTEPRARFLSRNNPKVVPMRRPMEVSMLKPTSIENAKEICDYLLAGKAVVLNMEGIHTEVAQRIIDFTSGATYSMNGNLQKISSYIFIATPESVELSGEFQDLLNDSTLDMSRMNLRL